MLLARTYVDDIDKLDGHNEPDVVNYTEDIYKYYKAALAILFPRFLLISSLHELLNTHLMLLRSKFHTLAVTCFPVFWWEKIFRSQVVLDIDILRQGAKKDSCFMSS